ncbi:MAG: TonB family protein [Croceibacterium sp.]
MPILPLLAASLLSAPEPDPSLWHGRFDYPTKALRQEQSGAVYLRLWFDPTGREYRCDVLQVFGDAIFAESACKAVRRAKFRPAKSSNGGPSFGATTTLRSYTLAGPEGDSVRGIKTPTEITLEDIPGFANDAIPNFGIAAQVMEDGTVAACEGSDASTPLPLVQAACDRAEQMPRQIGQDAEGNVVSYVSGLRVGPNRATN